MSTSIEQSYTRMFAWLALATLVVSAAVNIIVDDSLHGNHPNVLTPEAGINCNCAYPFCGCLQITLAPTSILTAIPTSGSINTPIAPTAETIPSVTAIATVVVPTSPPVAVPPTPLTVPTMPPAPTAETLPTIAPPPTVPPAPASPTPEGL